MPECTGPDAGCRLGSETAFLIKSEFSFIAVKGGRVIIQRGAYETGHSAETLRKELSAIAGSRSASATGLGSPGLGVCRQCQTHRHTASTENRIRREQRRGGTQSIPSPLHGMGEMWGAAPAATGGLIVALRGGSTPLPGWVGSAPGQFVLRGL